LCHTLNFVFCENCNPPDSRARFYGPDCFKSHTSDLNQHTFPKSRTHSSMSTSFGDVGLREGEWGGGGEVCLATRFAPGVVKRGPRPIGHHRTHRGGAHGVPWVRVPRQCPGRGGRRPHSAHAPTGWDCPQPIGCDAGLHSCTNIRPFQEAESSAKCFIFFKAGLDSGWLGVSLTLGQKQKPEPMGEE